MKHYSANKILTLTILFAVMLQAIATARDEFPPAVKEASNASFQCLREDDTQACFSGQGFVCSQQGDRSRNAYSCYVSIDGYCYRRRFQLKDRGWSGNEDWSLGACEPTFDIPLADGVRAQYDNVNAPDSVRFRFLLSKVFSEVVHEENAGGAEKFFVAGTTSKTDTKHLVDYFVSEHWKILNEVYDEQTALLCESGKPRFTDSWLYATFDAFDDIRFKAYERHLERVRTEFAADETFDLEKALSGFPGSFSTTTYATTGDLDFLQERAELRCSTPLSMQFSTGRDIPAD